MRNSLELPFFIVTRAVQETTLLPVLKFRPEIAEVNSNETLDRYPGAIALLPGICQKPSQQIGNQSLR